MPGISLESECGEIFGRRRGRDGHTYANTNLDQESGHAKPRPARQLHRLSLSFAHLSFAHHDYFGKPDRESQTAGLG